MLTEPKVALSIVLGGVKPLPSTVRPLPEAAGSCLAQDVHAARDLPPTDRSAMDGFAVRARDVAKLPRQLRRTGEVPAGSARRPVVRPGACVGVLTGAVVPRGADAVVRVEDVRETDGIVTVEAPVRRGDHIRRRGENALRGDLVLPRGTVLGPAQIGLAALVGRASLRVRRAPVAAVLSTGQELCGPKQRARAHQVHDANGPALVAALRAAGCCDVSHRIVGDDPDAIADALGAAIDGCDVVVLSGGVSVGKYDFVPQAVRRLGAKVRFHGVRMKPGKPQLYATLSRNRHVFALPGNPVSVLAGLNLLVLPAIRRLMGVPAAQCRPLLRLPLARAAPAVKGRVALVLARLVSAADGVRVQPVASRGSADLVSAASADGVFFLAPEQGRAPKGRLVEFLPWRPIQ